MEDDFVIFHSPCSDGLMAAWIFRQVMPDAVFFPAKYGSDPPDVSNKNVYIVDFSYSRDIILDMKAKAKSLIVLDHHKSVQEHLKDLPFCHFDMNRSGAGMAWDYLFPDKERHWLVDYVEDKDLWNWKLPNSLEINCSIQSYPLTFESMDALSNKNPKSLILEGSSILRSQRNMVNNIVKNAREVEMHGYKVLMVNTPVLQSEVAGFLAYDRPFGVAWFENENGEKVFSLRSKEGGADVSKIAAKYNGGGHKLSAGFRLLKNQEL